MSPISTPLAASMSATSRFRKNRSVSGAGAGINGTAASRRACCRSAARDLRHIAQPHDRRLAVSRAALTFHVSGKRLLATNADKMHAESMTNQVLLRIRIHALAVLIPNSAFVLFAA